jgi:bifunctional non-homologous end joining protein LigD
MPEWVEPMLAKPGELPGDEGWAYEIKWDGIRALAFAEGGRIKLMSRRKLVINGYPELTALGRALGTHEAILDGEIVAFENGLPSFQKLQSRMNLTSEAQIRRMAASTPIVYMLFDLLWLDGHSLMEQSYEDRRRLLAKLELTGAAWQTPAYHVGDGAALLEASKAQGLEGVVAKRLDSPYVRGRRSASWRKVKITAQQELVVGGWIPGEGRLESTVGALIVGYHDGPGGPLRYAGRVGSGLDDATRDRYTEEFRARARRDCPFDPPPPAPVRRIAQWVEPELVVEVRFTMWTSDDVLRNPVYLGERDDKDPADVVRE